MDCIRTTGMLSVLWWTGNTWFRIWREKCFISMKTEFIRPMFRSVSDITYGGHRSDLERNEMPTAVVSVQYDVPRVLMRAPCCSPSHGTRRKPIPFTVTTSSHKNNDKNKRNTDLQIEANASYHASPILVIKNGMYLWNVYTNKHTNDQDSTIYFCVNYFLMFKYLWWNKLRWLNCVVWINIFYIIVIWLLLHILIFITSANYSYHNI